MSVSVPFVPNVVAQHVSGFVACCVEATHYKWKVPSYLWVMWHTMLVSVYAISVILQDIICYLFVSHLMRPFQCVIGYKNVSKKMTKNNILMVETKEICI